MRRRHLPLHQPRGQDAARGQEVECDLRGALAQEVGVRRMPAAPGQGGGDEVILRRLPEGALGEQVLTAHGPEVLAGLVARNAVGPAPVLLQLLLHGLPPRGLLLLSGLPRLPHAQVHLHRVLPREPRLLLLPEPPLQLPQHRLLQAPLLLGQAGQRLPLALDEGLVPGEPTRSPLTRVRGQHHRHHAPVANVAARQPEPHRRPCRAARQHQQHGCESKPPDHRTTCHGLSTCLPVRPAGAQATP